METPLQQVNVLNRGAVLFGGRYSSGAARPARMFFPLGALRNKQTASEAAENIVAARKLNSVPQFLADIAAITALSILMGIIFHEVVHSSKGPLAAFIYVGVFAGILFGWIGKSVVSHRSGVQTTTFGRMRDISWAWTLAIAALVFCAFALKAGESLSRGWVLSLYIAGLPAMVLWRMFTPALIAKIATKTSGAIRKSIIIGDTSDPLLEAFAANLKDSDQFDPIVLRLQAVCPRSQWDGELKDLFTRVAETAKTIGSGEIYICAGTIPVERLSALERVLAVIPRALYVVPDAQMSSLVRCSPRVVGGMVAFEVRCEPLAPAQRVMKRLMDIAVSASALVFLAPLFVAVAVCIKLDSRGPVFFRQTRNGYQGRPFRIWKFRSMTVMEDGPNLVQARKNDPRVTRVGAFLRKSSIDELPQLLNILAGDMSLVGPRPHAAVHDERYSQIIEHYEIRQHVKPGLTGWAQVNGLRGETATVDLMYQRIEYDLWYASNASIFLDIEIIIRTIFEIFRHRNAY